MITSELIAKNEVLNTLTDEQKNAILVLSENEEKNSFGAKLGEIYRQLDATIEKTTGIKRDGDEKTYLYLERAAKAVAAERNKLTAEKSCGLVDILRQLLLPWGRNRSGGPPLKVSGRERTEIA